MRSKLTFVPLFLFCCSVAFADSIPLTGSRSTPPENGVTATVSWASGFNISWVITPVGSNWQYEYTVSAAGGKGVSHFILQVSSNFTADDIWDVRLQGNAIGIDGPTGFGRDPNSPNATSPGANGGNPNLPADLFGVKFDINGMSAFSLTFMSSRPPMWGDFYAKDGNDNGGVATAWNTGIGQAPGGDNIGKIAVPDTTTVPEPGTLLLLGLGLLAVGVLRRLLASS